MIIEAIKGLHGEEASEAALVTAKTGSDVPTKTHDDEISIDPHRRLVDVIDDAWERTSDRNRTSKMYDVLNIPRT